MRFRIINNFSSEILKETDPPFISLYQPTHRHRPDNKQDIIRYKNLVRRIEDSLEQSYSRRVREEILKPFKVLAQDQSFWNHTLDGLAVLARRNRGVVLKLHRPVKELAVVADSFHIKPLIRVFQSADRYQLLGLNRGEFTLYEGNRYGFEEIELDPGTPRTAEDVLGTDYPEKYVTFGSYAGPVGRGAFHGHGGRKEEIDKYTERFFRYVDQFVCENYSRPSGLPLILVSLPEHFSLFQKISRNPLLMKDGLKVAFNALTVQELKDTVWAKIESLYLERTKRLVEGFEAARAEFLASDDVVQIVRAAWENRVATVMIESDRIIPGKIDLQNGKLIEGNLDDPEYDDVLDDIAEMVYNSKGEVVVLPKERMPTTTGAAAIFRY